MKEYNAGAPMVLHQGGRNGRENRGSGRKARKIVIWVLAGTILITFVVLFFSGRVFNIDGLKRAFTYMNAEKDESGLLREIKFLNQTGNSFDDYNGGLAIASSTGAEIINRDGESIASCPVSLKTPAVQTVGQRSLIYDVGGTELMVFDAGELVFRRDSEEPIITAALNPSGYLSIVSGESKYKGSVTVYNASLKEELKSYVSSGYIINAVVSPDNAYMVSASLMHIDGDFCTKLARFDLNSKDEVAAYYIVDSAAIKLGFIESGVLCAVTESSVVFLNRDLELLGQYDMGSRYLKSANFSENGYAALFLGEQKSGNRAVIVTLDSGGEVIGELEITQELLDISVKGRYIALLFSDSAEIYTADMEYYSSISNSARSVIMRSDGTLMLVSIDAARLYIP